MLSPQPEPTEPGNATLRSRLTREQLARLAEHVADEGSGIPPDLAPDQERILTDLVRRRLRDRLIQYIARAVAQDLLRGDGSTPRMEH